MGNKLVQIIIPSVTSIKPTVRVRCPGVDMFIPFFGNMVNGFCFRPFYFVDGQQL